jgi:tRNA uridine 5-carboxymethylaminomethyl modification enzyme
LTDKGRELGLVDDARWSTFDRKRDAIARETERLRSTYVSTGFQQKHSLYELLRRPEATYLSLIGRSDLDAGVTEQVETQAKYEGYIERQRAEVARCEEFESLRLPEDIDYQSVRGLSIEVQQKLNRHRPETVGQAARISGVTPAAISLLLVHLKRGFQPPQKKTA